MDLIEKLGGYDKAKSALSWLEKNEPIHSWIKPNLLDALLRYRRANGIYEVGDWVVFRNPNNALDRNSLGKGEVLKIKDIDFYDYLIFNCSRHGHGQKWFRHATDEEIKAGRREVGCAD